MKNLGKTQSGLVRMFILFPAICLLGFAFAVSVNAQEVLQIEKSGPASSIPGSEMTYVIEVSNTGTVPAVNVVITDILPAEGSYTYVSSLPAGTFASNRLTWDVSLLGSDVLTFLVVIKPGIFSPVTGEYYMPGGIDELRNEATIQSDGTKVAIHSKTIVTAITQQTGNSDFE